MLACACDVEHVQALVLLAAAAFGPAATAEVLVPRGAPCWSGPKALMPGLRRSLALSQAYAFRNAPHLPFRADAPYEYYLDPVSATTMHWSKRVDEEVTDHAVTQMKLEEAHMTIAKLQSELSAAQEKADLAESKMASKQAELDTAGEQIHVLHNSLAAHQRVHHCGAMLQAEKRASTKSAVLYPDGRARWNQSTR